MVVMILFKRVNLHLLFRQIDAINTASVLRSPSAIKAGQAAIEVSPHLTIIFGINSQHSVLLSAAIQSPIKIILDMRKTNVFVCQQQRHFNQSVRPTLDVYGCKRKKKKKFWTKTEYTCLVVSFVFLFLRKEKLSIPSSSKQKNGISLIYSTDGSN